MFHVMFFTVRFVTWGWEFEVSGPTRPGQRDFLNPSNTSPEDFWGQTWPDSRQLWVQVCPEPNYRNFNLGSVFHSQNLRCVSGANCCALYSDFKIREDPRRLARKEPFNVRNIWNFCRTSSISVFLRGSG